MKDGKIAVVESEAEQVRLIFKRYLELSGVNALVRDLKERNIRTKARPLATGGTRGGIPFERGTLFYLLRNRFYIGEVRYRGEILPGEQPPIMERALFDAVQQKLTDQWTTRTNIRNAGDHLLTGLLFDDAGHRMAPTHATKAGIRYRYYVSLPCLHGEAKTAKVGSITRVPHGWFGWCRKRRHGDGTLRSLRNERQGRRDCSLADKANPMRVQSPR